MSIRFDRSDLFGLIVFIVLIAVSDFFLDGHTYLIFLAGYVAGILQEAMEKGDS